MNDRRCRLERVVLVLGLLIHPIGALNAAVDPQRTSAAQTEPIRKPYQSSAPAVVTLVAVMDATVETPWSLSGNAISYLNLGNYISGMIPVLASTVNETLLGYLFKYIDNMISKAVPVTEKDSKGLSHTHLAWTVGVPPPGNPVVDSAQEGYLFAAAAQIARAAAMLQDVPQWKAKYASKIQKYLSTVDDMVIQRFYNDKYGGQMPWLNGKVWEERAGWLGGLAASLYHATKNTLYSNIATQIAGAFKARLQPNKTGWIWDQGAIPIGSNQAPLPTPVAGDVGNLAGVPDTNGANAAVYMMAMTHEEGLGFSNEDMVRMANTLTDTMWNRDSDNLVLSNYIDGSNQAFRFQSRPGSNAFLGLGWSLLARYSMTAQTLVSNILVDVSINHTATPSINASSDFSTQTAMYGSLTRFPLDAANIPIPNFTPQEVGQLTYAKYYLPVAHLQGLTLIQALPLSERPSSLQSDQYWDTIDSTINIYVGDYNSRLQHPANINTLFAKAVGNRLYNTLSQDQKNEFASFFQSIPAGDPNFIQNKFSEEYSNWVNRSSLDASLGALPNVDTNKFGRALFMASFFMSPGSLPTQATLTTYSVDGQQRLVGAGMAASRTSQVLTLGSFELSLQGNTIVAARRSGGAWSSIGAKTLAIPASLLAKLPQVTPVLSPNLIPTVLESMNRPQRGVLPQSPVLVSPSAPDSYIPVLSQEGARILGLMNSGSAFNLRINPHAIIEIKQVQ